MRTREDTAERFASWPDSFANSVAGALKPSIKLYNL